MSPFLTRLLALAEKELRHVVRDPQAVYLALGMPVVMVVLFGFAVSFDVEEVEVAVVDQDHTPATRRLIARIHASDAFEVVERLPSPSLAEARFRGDDLKAVFVFPRGFHRSLERGERAEVQLLMDGADAATARVAVGYAEQLGLRETQDRLIRPADAAPPVSPRVRTWFNPGMESGKLVVPGVVAIVLSVLSVLLSALTVAREWERGSMEQLFATPVDQLAVVLGKIIPYVGLGLIQFLLVLSAGAWIFDVPLRGSFLLVTGAVALFLACSLGQGLLISMVTKSQQVATQVGAVSSILPSLLLSGFLFPIDNMPLPLQALSRIVPARYLITVLRGALLQGRGFLDLWPALVGLFVLGAVLVGLTAVRFRRRLDA